MRIFCLSNLTISVDFPAGRRPFRLAFKTDGDEQTYSNMAAIKDETASAPGGIIGFSLDYWQVPCTNAAG